AEVVALVDHHAFAGHVLRVEVAIEPTQRRFGHVGQMHVAQLAAADLRDVGAIARDPRVVGERTERAAVDRLHLDVARAVPARDAQRGLLADAVFQQRVQVVARADRVAIDRLQRVADLDAGDSGTTCTTRSVPSRSYAAVSNTRPSRPVTGCECAFARTPECEAFNSPTNRFISQVTLAGVGAPAISGAYSARTAFQSTPFIRGSWKLSRSHVHAWSNAVILSCAKSMST